MKVVHLVTSTSGGAAQAAIRLHESLSQEGYDSNVLSVQRRIKPTFTNGIKFQKIGKFSLYKSSALTLFQRRIIQAGVDLASPISLDLLNWQDPVIKGADVLHLHAFYNLVSIKSFLRKFPEKKKVITLHDERFYTGGCHYSHECLQLESGCQDCPQVQPLFHSLVKKQKSDLDKFLETVSSLALVCPSRWILKRASEAIGKTNKIHFFQIYNPIPSMAAPPKANESSNFKTRFGFISDNLNNPLKNLPLLLSAFKKLAKANPGEYSLTLVGASEINYSMDSPIIKQRVAKNRTELQAILSSIDVLVVPSTHDNLPNVLGEALMNGVGLIGSDVGGISEVIELFSQSLFQSGNLEGLIHAMRNYQISDRVKLQKLAEQHFGYQAIANNMQIVYSL